MRRDFAGLYGITDPNRGEVIEQGLALIEGGVCALQLRCKGWTEEKIRTAAMHLQGPCEQAGVPLILNDFPAIAPLGHGVHLGQEDGRFNRSTLPDSCIVGRSVHDLASLQAAEAEGVDYVGFGPIFESTTKPGARSARGLEALALITAQTSLPVVAIGGIKAMHLPALKEAGARCWAPMGALLSCDNLLAACQRFS